MSISVRAQPLTPAAFAPYGSIIAAPDRSPDISTPHNRYWDHAAPFRVSGVPQVGFLEVYQRPLIVPTLERHLLHTQGFIPLAGAPLVKVVAAPSEDGVPDPSTIRAFHLDGSVGVVLHEGTWHHLLFPLVPTAHVLLLLQDGTKEHDMHVVTLPEPVEVQV